MESCVSANGVYVIVGTRQDGLSRTGTLVKSFDSLGFTIHVVISFFFFFSILLGFVIVYIFE